MSAALSRADLLKNGGVLLVSFSLLGSPRIARADEVLTGPDPLRVDSWLAISKTGDVTVYSGKIDAGSGIRTTFTQIVADELDVPMNRITMILGDTARTPNQEKATASTGVSVGVQPLRVAAAEARAALAALGATRLGLGPDQVGTRDGAVYSKLDPKATIAYGELIGTQILDIRLKKIRDTQWGPLLEGKAPLQSYKVRKMVGKAVPRFDLPAKATGAFLYVHNVRRPGMLHGRVVRPPARGAHLLSIDEHSLAGIPNVRVVRKGDFLGVVAHREEHAVKAASKLRATWTAGTPLPNQQSQYDDLRSGKVVGQTDNRKVGDVETALSSAKRRFAARYNFPYQLHGMLGPSCAVADVQPRKVTIWSGTQWPSGTRRDVAQTLGIDPSSVEVVWHEASGSYGRLGVDDASCDAALLSAAVGKPVRVQWMRHDEHGFEPPSPGVAIDIEAALDEDGHITAFSLNQHALSTALAESDNTIALRLLGDAHPTTRLAGNPSDLPYDIPAFRLRSTYVEGPHRTLFMRAPGLQQTASGIEAFIDELAEAAGVNPVTFRLRQITNLRDRNVLTTALELSGWDGRRSSTRGAAHDLLTGRGVAVIRWSADGTRLANVAEVTVQRSTGIVRVRRLFVACDCGLVVNPDGLLNQIQGGTLQGVSRSLHEEWTFDAKGATSLDWRAYPILRFSEVPELKVALLDRPDDPPSGAGEAGTVPTTAAIGNAIYDATGKRPREAPFTPERIRALLSS